MFEFDKHSSTRSELKSKAVSCFYRLLLLFALSVFVSCAVKDALYSDPHSKILAVQYILHYLNLDYSNAKSFL